MSAAQEVDDLGRCKLHPGIQLRHQKRSGEWRVLLRACPLCVSGLPPTAPRPDDASPPSTESTAAAAADAEPERAEGGGDERPGDAGRSPGGRSASRKKSSSSGRSSRDARDEDRLANSERQRRKSRRKDKERISRDERRRGGKDGKRGDGRSKSRGRAEEKPDGDDGDDGGGVEGGGECDVPPQHPLQRKSSGRPRSPSPQQSPRVERTQPRDGETDGLPSPPIRYKTREDEAREYNSFVNFIQRDRQKMAEAQGPMQQKQETAGHAGTQRTGLDDGEDHYDDEEDEDQRTQDTVSDESDRADGDEDVDGSNSDRTVDEEADASFHSGTRPADDQQGHSRGPPPPPPPPPPPFHRQHQQQRDQPPLPTQAASRSPPRYGGGGFDVAGQWEEAPTEPVEGSHIAPNYDGYDPDEQGYDRKGDEERRGENEDEVPGLDSASGQGNDDMATVLEQDEVSVMSMSSVTKNIRRDAVEARTPLERHEEEGEDDDDSSSSSSDDSSSSDEDSSSSREKKSRRRGDRRRKSGRSGHGRPGGDDVRSSGSSRNTRGSAERAIPTFDPDERGFCRRHPTVRLRKKKLMRGWTVKLSNCPECCLDEMRRVKESRMRARKSGGGGSSPRRSGRRRGRDDRKSKRKPPISQLNYRAKDDDRSVGTASTITISSHTASGVGVGVGSGSVRSASPQKAPAHVTRMPFTDATGRGGWYTGQVDPDTGSPSGSGTMNYSDGDTYDGEWAGGAPAGQRRLPLPDRPAGRLGGTWHARSPPQHYRHRGPGGAGSPLQYGYKRTPSGRSYLETLDEDAPPPPPPGRMPLGRPSGPIPGERRVVCGMSWVDRHGDSGLYTGEVDADGVPDGIGSSEFRPFLSLFSPRT